MYVELYRPQSVCSNRVIQQGRRGMVYCSETRTRCSWYKAAPCIAWDVTKFVTRSVYRMWIPRER